MKRWDTSDLPGHVFSEPFEQPISRREALRRGGVAAAALGTASMFNTAVALGATGPQPRPIPGGFDATFTPVPPGHLRLHMNRSVRGCRGHLRAGS